MHHLKALIPSIVLALGILGSTALAKSLPETFGSMLIAAAGLAGSILLAGFLHHRYEGGGAGLAAPFLLSAIFFAAAAILAVKNPASVPSVLPILGCGAVVLILPSRRSNCCSEPQST